MLNLKRREAITIKEKSKVKEEEKREAEPSFRRDNQIRIEPLDDNAGAT
ncbi:hypothetical protein JCM14036_16250 [Desulfotomaculum defluvii]